MKRVTYGLEWLGHSLASFNGSGYADKQSPEHYVASYKAYKTMKRDNYALKMLESSSAEATEIARKLIYARDSSHVPSVKNYAKFKNYYSPVRDN